MWSILDDRTLKTGHEDWAEKSRHYNRRPERWNVVLKSFFFKRHTTETAWHFTFLKGTTFCIESRTCSQKYESEHTSSMKMWRLNLPKHTKLKCSMGFPELTYEGYLHLRQVSCSLSSKILHLLYMCIFQIIKWIPFSFKGPKVGKLRPSIYDLYVIFEIPHGLLTHLLEYRLPSDSWKML